MNYTLFKTDHNITGVFVMLLALSPHSGSEYVLIFCNLVKPAFVWSFFFVSYWSMYDLLLVLSCSCLVLVIKIFVERLLCDAVVEKGDWTIILSR